MLANRGKSANAVFAASTRMANVAYWKHVVHRPHAENVASELRQHRLVARRHHRVVPREPTLTAEKEDGENGDHPAERVRGIARCRRLNALMPFEIASVPVIAAHPSANPRRIREKKARTRRALSAACRRDRTMCAADDSERPCPGRRYRPDTDQRQHDRDEHERRNGTRCRDSRTPRRLTTISSSTAPTQIATAYGARQGTPT